jgi:hypothetical protein
MLKYFMEGPLWVARARGLHAGASLTRRGDV